jgi:hypothetical protein
MLRTFSPGVGICDLGYIANAKQKSKDAANKLVFSNCCIQNDGCYNLPVLDGGNPSSAPSYFVNGGAPNSSPSCFINGGNP